jgi:hypothetical protein
LHIDESLPSDTSNNWHGARFFFLIGNQSLPSPPTNPTTVITPQSSTTTKPTEEDTTIKHTDRNPNHGPTIAGVVVAVVVVVLGLIGIIYYRRRRSSPKTTDAPTIEYRRKTETVHGDMSERNEKRSSIPPAALRGPAISTFISPFFMSKNIEDEADV